MDNLFGVPMTSIMVGLLILLGISLGVLALIAWRHPLLVRMGLRNIGRRRSQASLIVLGLMLSTLIISAAFATGDTVGYSITNQFYQELQQADVIVSFDNDVVVPEDEEHLTDDLLTQLVRDFGDDPRIDGITGAIIEGLPAVNEAARLSEPEATIVGVDAETIGAFDVLRTAGGAAVSMAELTSDQALITEALAEEIDAGPGDTVTTFFEGIPHRFDVVAVVRDSSLTGSLETFGAGSVRGGILVRLDAARELVDAPGELTLIAISMTGGIRDTVDASGEFGDELEDYLAARPEAQAEVSFTKEEAITLGETIGSVFVTFFLIFGLFSIAAGILLIFLIFVMLAAERRSEMGMARAIGMRRMHVTETFLAEGMAYNIGSAAVGALLGLGVAGLLVYVLTQVGDEFGINISYHFNWQGFVVAYSLGVVLTFITVAFSSWRAANINIVRAIRDLPDPQPLRGANRSVGGLLKAAVGALWVVAWVAIIGLLVVLAFQIFVLSLAFYGLPFLVVIPIGMLLWYGMQVIQRGPLTKLSGARPWILLGLWFVLFNVLALILLGLLKSRKWAARHRNVGGWAVVMLITGGLLVYFSGWDLGGNFLGGAAYAYTGGTTLAVLAVAMLAVYFGINSRPAFTTAGLLLVWYWLLPLPFTLFKDPSTVDRFDPLDGISRILGLPRPVDITGDIEMFFVSGICVTAAGTLVVIFNADLILRVVSAAGGALGGIAPALRTAIAYPLAAKFRTGMTLAMFGLVVFSLVVMAFLNFNFSQVFLGQEATVGFDVVANVNPNNRIPDLRAALEEEGYPSSNGIEGIGKIVAAFPLIREDREGAEADRYRVNGFDDAFLELAEIPLQLRAIGYDTDEAVFEALRTDPTLAIVDASRLRQEGLFAEVEDDVFALEVSADDLRDEPWQPIPIVLQSPGGGEELRLNIIAVVEPQVTSVLFSLTGIFTQAGTVERVFDGGELEDYYITTRDPSKEAVTDVARGIESTLLERGVQAERIQELIDDAAGASAAFQLLFEGFMGLGLIVGIAALGVIAFRTVVERRQQIGMLRAIGYQRRLISLSFFFESSFIALAGILMGLLLGSALSYNLLTSPDFTDGAEIDFQVPWVRLLVISGVAYGASAAMTVLSARAAARVPVADALRYE